MFCDFCCYSTRTVYVIKISLLKLVESYLFFYYVRNTIYLRSDFLEQRLLSYKITFWYIR